MAGSTLEINATYTQEDLAKEVAHTWDKYNRNRAVWLAQKRELRNYLFATDTSTTTNRTLPWKNSTTVPKLCQIRDNLHANYASALFPSEWWFAWEGGNAESMLAEKNLIITSYMQNKVAFGNFRTEVYKLLYDYIDYGNAFYDIDYYNESYKDDKGTVIPGFIGAKLRRISPEDIVFNPSSVSFDDSFKIVRSIKTYGDLLREQEQQDTAWADEAAMTKLKIARATMMRYTIDDMNKFNAFAIDGFGSMFEYFSSGYIELLEFEGSIYDAHHDVYLHNYRLIVADRSFVLYAKPIETWTGKSLKGHVGWRMRPDNLYAMGPLDNLVGMQYRIDHLENAKADAYDLAIHPPLLISGDVDEFNWGPGQQVYARNGGTIVEMGKSLNAVIQANTEIAILEQKMEEMAGAPKQAMGIRTPGEKTAYEVQTLEMAASRIFQNKIQHFEIELIEPALNKLLEVSRRKLDTFDVVRVMDTESGVVEFIKITKEDITASGKLRAIGARHFAINATIIQNLTALHNSGLTQDPLIQNHISPKQMVKVVESLLGVERFRIVKPYARIFEAAEAQQVAGVAGQQTEEVISTPLTPETPGDLL